MSARTISRYRRLVFLTWFLTLDLIMFGAFVRLTDSGLGCPDWPGCYGKLSPFGASSHISQALAEMPYGPVSFSKAWIEMIHRYAGSLLGMMIIGITYMAWRYRGVLGNTPRLATVTLIAVCIQGAFGAWTVTHKLMPIIVTTHLLGGMLLLALMTWLAAREQIPPRCASGLLPPEEALSTLGRPGGGKQHAPLDKSAASLKPWTAIGLLLLFTQIALGGWVSTNYAALACMDFPTCHGQWVPQMDFHGGFSLIRALGELPTGEMISQQALTAIHWVHRNFAFFVFAWLGLLAWRLRRHEGLRGPANLLLALLLAQLFTGLTTIFFQWPLLIAVLHNGGAAGLVLACTTLLVRLARIDDTSRKPS
ncbi:COX15/CtaA family protein [Paracandidimonas soli]|uniref:Cytochrome c oxidase assembly protein subunit 15 n=1 Tax=Paracandidimonas soli TaxID=1917182 RepID=A0A4R3VG61_9BURK|nr:COX15/CtaA family protein [Paracandidimonas soli]TCV02782.1 cytochrome c oxidase assembly protein subunit 15 [Paracandidimonas soli]